MYLEESGLDSGVDIPGPGAENIGVRAVWE